MSNSNDMAPMTSDYNQLNQSQSTVWRCVQPLFAKTLPKLLQQQQQSMTTFRVADLGCATGGNSVAPLSYISKQLSSSTTVAYLEIFLGDLPPNAWNSVVSTVTPESIATTLRDADATDGDSSTATTHRTPSNTFVYMVGRTFYEANVPPASLDLSYSLVAVHWMKSYAGDIESGLYATDPLHNTNPTLLQAWRDAGAKDFADFTKARHDELKVGGRFIGTIACPKENGDYPWSRVGRPIYDALMKQKNVLPSELAACVLPCCWRTEQDVRAGFEEGWDMEICEFHETKDPVRESLERGEMTSLEYAEAVISSFKAVCHRTCIQSFVGSKTLSKEGFETILNKAYSEAIPTIAENPEMYNLDVSFWYVVAKKIAK